MTTINTSNDSPEPRTSEPLEIGEILGRPLALEVDDLTYDYARPAAQGGPVRALDAVSFRVAAGERVAIVGPSGAGKSTLLSIIAGELRQSGGCVRLSGACWNRLRAADARRLKTAIGRVYQDFRLVPTSSALHNVLLGRLGSTSMLGSMFGFGRGERDRARALLAEMDLAGRESTPARRLSGGEKQRVALARALMQRPGLLIADEPVASLDAQLREQVVERLIDINERRGISVVGVFHDLALAERFAPRVLVLCRGGLVFDGPSSQLGERVCRLLEWKLGNPAAA
jgi:phosphonate transport system ATP-binding protein